MRTQRERAIALVHAIDTAEAMPRATIRSLRKLLLEWRQPAIGDKTAIGAGTHATLLRLVNASVAYNQALEDAKDILEIK